MTNPEYDDVSSDEETNPRKRKQDEAFELPNAKRVATPSRSILKYDGPPYSRDKEVSIKTRDKEILLPPDIDGSAKASRISDDYPEVRRLDILHKIIHNPKHPEYSKHIGNADQIVAELRRRRSHDPETKAELDDMKKEANNLQPYKKDGKTEHAVRANQAYGIEPSKKLIKKWAAKLTKREEEKRAAPPTR